MSVYLEAERNPEVREMLREVEAHYPDFYRMHPSAKAHYWRLVHGNRRPTNMARMMRAWNGVDFNNPAARKLPDSPERTP